MHHGVLGASERRRRRTLPNAAVLPKRLVTRRQPQPPPVTSSGATPLRSAPPHLLPVANPSMNVPISKSSELPPDSSVRRLACLPETRLRRCDCHLTVLTLSSSGLVLASTSIQSSPVLSLCTLCTGPITRKRYVPRNLISCQRSHALLSKTRVEQPRVGSHTAAASHQASLRPYQFTACELAQVARSRTPLSFSS